MKIWKTILYLFLLLLGGQNLTAQKLKTNAGGLYSTLEDFVRHKLTYPTDCGLSSDKIRINDLFGSSTGYVIHNGEKTSFNKGEIYGYRNCNSTNFRFYHNEAYQILDTLGFYLYYNYRSVQRQKGKGLIKTDQYYFSRSGDGELQTLTIDNLKMAFSDNSAFHYALDASFPSDRDLLAFDSYQKQYKLKYLYKQSLQL